MSISLDKLPGYLNSVRNGDAGGSNVVDMGQIIVPRSPWPKRIAFSMLAFVALGVGSVTYNAMSTDHFTVVMDADPQSISQIVADSEGQILSVTQKEGSTYEVKVAPRKNGRSFLEWLRKHGHVRKADLE